MRKMVWLLCVLVCGVAQAGVVIPVEMKSGGWEFVARAQAPDYTGPDCFNPAWKPLVKPAGPALIQWHAPLAHARHGRPISVRVLLGEDNGWYAAAASSRLWLSGKGEGQRAFQAVCAPDVTQMLDENSESYGLWLAVEYQDGTRLPFYGAAFPTLATAADGKVAAADWCMRVPAGYDLAAAQSRAGNQPQSLGQGQTRVVTQGRVTGFMGRVWTWEKWIGVEKASGPALISWPRAQADAENGKVVKYIVYFGSTDALPFNGDAARLKQWLELKGEGQWGWCLECAPDVTQILDTNTEGACRLWLAVEFESGKRVGYQGSQCPKVVPFTESMRNLVDKSAAKMPQGYKPESDKMDIRGRLGAYLKVGRQWTLRITSKVVNAGENVSLVRTEILSVSDEEVEYRYTELDAAGQPIAGVEPQSLKLQLLVPRPRDPKPEPAATEETITVQAGTFDCLRTVVEGMGAKTITWMSKRFPGLIVKQVVTGETTEQVQELVEFKE
ncbi:MAG: hypothetical protein DCC64_02560 [Planctomycetota bacterium]|nr:MAG: hypothetical protein DCC64_02560 [Planctomycetota bacterium]